MVGPTTWATGQGQGVVRTATLAVAMTCLAAAPASAQSFTDPDVAFRVGDIAFLGDAPDALTIGAGAFNVITNDDDLAGTAGELRLEYRFGGKWYAIGPMLGALVNT